MQVRRYTIQDVAKEARVGVGTVSRVLNDDPNVKTKTREHVQAVIERVGYQPSFTARSLRTQKSNTIGFISDAVATTPFAVNLIKGAQDAALEHGKLLLIVDADHKPHTRERALEHMLKRNVEGVVYAAMFHQEVNLSKAFKALPTVLVDCYSKDKSFPSSAPDEFQGGYDAAYELIRHGHKRIAIILGTRLDSPYPAMQGRYKGYEKALRDAGLPLRKTLVRVGDGDSKSSFDRTIELMKLAKPPTAIFCCTDRMALGTYDALKSLGMNIPNDVSIVGFDNQDVIAEQLYPPLSTMALPHEEMGRWAIEMLLRDKLEPNQHVFPCPFIERASIKRPEV